MAMFWYPCWIYPVYLFFFVKVILLKFWHDALSSYISQHERRVWQCFRCLGFPHTLNLPWIMILSCWVTSPWHHPWYHTLSNAFFCLTCLVRRWAGGGFKQSFGFAPLSKEVYLRLVIRFIKYLATMVIVSPQDLGLWDPFQMAELHGW